MGRVQGKVALVTGAARGIGQACARLLAAEGAGVMVTDILDDEGRQLVAEIEAAGGRAAFLHQDVTSEAEWQAVVDQTIETLGGLDILVNNAGIAQVASVEDATLADWERMQAVNLNSVFLGTQKAIAAMKTRGGGSIVNISSIEGIIGEPLAAAYNASKGGVRIFTKSAAIHCGRSGYNIRVNSVHPGFIETAMVGDAVAGLGEAAPAFQERILGEIVLGEMGKPEDIAYGVLYLASDESRYMTGTELIIDGGFTAH